MRVDKQAAMSAVFALHKFLCLMRHVVGEVGRGRL